jgi:hypothetical protein
MDCHPSLPLPGAEKVKKAKKDKEFARTATKYPGKKSSSTSAR